MNRPGPQQPRHPARSAFTLLEILVVIAIVAILVAITTMVGSAVINTGKKQATLGIIQTLDEALAAYVDQKGDIPPPLVEVPLSAFSEDYPERSFETLFLPAIDGRGRELVSDDLNTVNSVALFIESAKVVPETQTIINGINERFRQNYTADERVQPFLLTVFDAWGNPIRYVHPKFDGIIEREPRRLTDPGEPVNLMNPNKPFFVEGAMPTNALQRVRMKFVRRNLLITEDYEGDDPPTGADNPSQRPGFELLPDSDGGITSGGRPYFYSAGPDGNPATIEDNIYTAPPKHDDPGVI